MSVYIKEPSSTAQACVIWLHGLGADASDMQGLVNQLPLTACALRHVFVDAPYRPVTINAGVSMPAWYDIVGMKLTDREDQEGIKASDSRLRQIIDQQQKDGFQSSQIFLAGFSQGGAMALYTALSMEEPLAGVVALSAYLPLTSSIKTRQAKQLPLFLAGGEFDPVVLPEWTLASRDWLINAGFKQISWHSYPMEHSICANELKDLADWFKQQLVEERQ